MQSNNTPTLSHDAVASREGGEPVPKTLAELVDVLHAELGADGLDSARVDVGRIQRIMASYQSNPADWAHFALFDGSRYTRNLVDHGNGKFNLMVLCWGAGQASPIHDHANSHCLVKVLDGAVTETQYHWPSTDDVQTPSDGSCPMKIKQEETYTVNNVSYMHDRLGLHSVGNRTSAGAVTLHLYTPPYDSCKTFCEKTGQSRCSGKYTFHSTHGLKSTRTDDIRKSLAAKSMTNTSASNASEPNSNKGCGLMQARS